jgi:tetratricopeptide (TPR) repeat protein
MNSIKAHEKPQAPTWNEFVGLLTAGELENALGVSSRGSTTDDEPGRWLLGRAWVLMGLGRLDQALVSAMEAAERGADDILVSRTLATLYLKQGNIQDALDAAEYAYHLDDEDEASHRLLLNVRKARRQAAQPPAGAAPEASAKSADMPPDDTVPVSVAVAARVAASVAGGSAYQVTASQILGAPDLAPEPARTRGGQGKEISRLTLAGAQLTSQPDAQLEALYGMSLFGRWGALVAAAPVPGWTRYMRPDGTWRRAAVLATLGMLLLLGGGLVREALYRRHERLREHTLDHLRQILHSGAVDQLPEHLVADSDLIDVTVPDDSPLAHLAARAQATVYRFHDALPERLRSVRTAQAGAAWPGTYDAVVTRALLAPTAERLAMLPALTAAQRDNPKDGQAAFLAATAALRADDLTTASEAIAQALAIEPANLMILELAAVLDARRQRFDQTTNRVAEMRDTNPWSMWPALTEERLVLLYGAPARPAQPVDRRRRATVGPVLAGTGALFDAIRAERQADSAQATVAFRIAFEAVHGEPAFVIDYADTLLEARVPRLAALLVESPAWPAGSLAARAVVARLALLQGRRDEARRKLATVFSEGSRDPRVATALVDALDAAPPAGLDAVQVLTQTLETWPNRLDLEVQLAELLWSQNKAEILTQRLTPRLARFKSAAEPTLSARAFLFLARAASTHADHGEALQWLRRSLQLNPGDEQAQALQKELRAPPARKAPAGRAKGKRRGGRR